MSARIFRATVLMTWSAVSQVACLLRPVVEHPASAVVAMAANLVVEIPLKLLELDFGTGIWHFLFFGMVSISYASARVQRTCMTDNMFVVFSMLAAGSGSEARSAEDQRRAPAS